MTDVTTELAKLTASTTELTNTVVGKYAALDSKVTAAGDSADEAARSAIDAAQAASDADGSASNAESAASDAQAGANTATAAADDAQQSAGDAQSSASDAQQSAGDAQSSASDSERAAIDAQSSADAAALSGNVYADISAGLAATADGDYFSVISVNANNYLELYLNSNGSAVLQKVYPSTQAVDSVLSYSSTVWDSVSDTTTGEGITTGVTRTHENMKRCLLLDDGTVNYYLDPNNSNLKANGGASVLTGEDGQVMVEVPKCYVKTYKLGNQVVWSVSSEPRYGYVLHPAFTKDGTLQYDNKLDMWYYVGVTQEVDYVYVGAYLASVLDVSASEYIDGLNSDNNTGRVDTGTDKLSSVSSKYPMVGLTRAEFRSIANNRGAGWGDIDFWTHSLLQLLYTTEYRNLNSQAAIGQGATNVSGGYPTSSDIQVDSPHSNAGKSNSIGNQSGGVDSAVRDVPWMSYRGIENFWGNCYVWVDGVNILDQVYHVNNTGTFTENTTSSGYAQLGLQVPSENGYIRNVQSNTLGFIPSGLAGGSSNIAFSDYYYQNTGYRVMAGGGRAYDGALAGAFILLANYSSGIRYRTVGARVVYK